MAKIKPMHSREKWPEERACFEELGKQWIPLEPTSQWWLHKKHQRGTLRENLGVGDTKGRPNEMFSIIKKNITSSRSIASWTSFPPKHAHEVIGVSPHLPPPDTFPPDNSTPLGTDSREVSWRQTSKESGLAAQNRSCCQREARNHMKSRQSTGRFIIIIIF